MDIVQEKVASGLYQSEEQVLTAALHLLAQHDSALEGIEEGLRDLREGRIRDWDEADAEFRARHQIPLDDD